MHFNFSTSLVLSENNILILHCSCTTVAVRESWHRVGAHFPWSDYDAQTDFITVLGLLLQSPIYAWSGGISDLCLGCPTALSTPSGSFLTSKGITYAHCWNGWAECWNRAIEYSFAQCLLPVWDLEKKISPQEVIDYSTVDSVHCSAERWDSTLCAPWFPSRWKMLFMLVITLWWLTSPDGLKSDPPCCWSLWRACVFGPQSDGCHWESSVFLLWKTGAPTWCPGPVICQPRGGYTLPWQSGFRHGMEDPRWIFSSNCHNSPNLSCWFSAFTHAPQAEESLSTSSLLLERLSQPSW